MILRECKYFFFLFFSCFDDTMQISLDEEEGTLEVFQESISCSQKCQFFYDGPDIPLIQSRAFWLKQEGKEVQHEQMQVGRLLPHHTYVLGTTRTVQPTVNTTGRRPSFGAVKDGSRSSYHTKINAAVCLKVCWILG